MSEMLKVSSTSKPSATAGALANTIREEGEAELQAIGPKAVNQAIKAITIARGYMAPSGVDLIFTPSFVDVEIDGEKKTAMRMFVDTRLPYSPRGVEKDNSTKRASSTPAKESDETTPISTADNKSGGQQLESHPPDEEGQEEERDESDNILDV